MRRTVKAGLAVGMAICLAMSGMVIPQDAAAAKKAVAPKKIVLNKKTVKLTVGKTFKIKVKKITPKKASKKVSAFKYKSSKTKVATVSKKGVIKAKKAGSAKITVTSKTKKKVKATIKVTVTKKKVVKKPTTTQAPVTQAPVVSATPTVAPVVSPSVAPSQAPGVTQAPDVTNPPATSTTPATAAPTKKPDQTPAKTPAKTTAPATAAPTAKPTVKPSYEEVTPGEDEVDGVTYYNYQLSNEKDYKATITKTDGEKLTAQLSVKQIPAILDQLTSMSSLYSNWEDGQKFTKTYGDTKYQFDTPDEKNPTTKTMTVVEGTPVFGDDKVEITMTKDDSLYKVKLVSADKSDSIDMTIAEEGNSVVVASTFNKVNYDAVIAKDKNTVKVYKNSNRVVAQLTKTEEGYDLAVSKAGADRKELVIEATKDAPTVPSYAYSMPLNEDTVVSDGPSEVVYNEDGTITVKVNSMFGGAIFTIPEGEEAASKGYDTVIINYVGGTGNFGHALRSGGKDNVLKWDSMYPSKEEVTQVVFTKKDANVDGYKVFCNDEAFLAEQEATLTILGIGFCKAADIPEPTVKPTAKPSPSTTPAATPGTTPSTTPGTTPVGPTPVVPEKPEEETPGTETTKVETPGTETSNVETKPVVVPIATPKPSSYTFDLANYKANGTVAGDDAVVLDEAGTLTIKFNTSYNGSSIAVPEDVDVSDFNMAVVDVTSYDEAGTELNGENQVVFSDSEGNEIGVRYGKGTISCPIPEGKKLGKVMINPQKGSADSIQVMKINCIKVTKVEALDLNNFIPNGATSSKVNEDGTFTAEFTGKYTGSAIEIPEDYAETAYFEVKARSVSAADNTKETGTQVVFIDENDQVCGVGYLAGWSQYTAKLMCPKGKKISKIVVNTQEEGSVLNIEYIKAGH